MTLDEMIAWLEQQAQARLHTAAHREKHRGGREAPALREEAATLLAIENALRAQRDGVARMEELRNRLADAQYESGPSEVIRG